MKKIVIALFLIAISGCAADKQSNKPPPADIKAYPEGLYAGDSSVAFFRAGKDGPLISLRSLVIGDAAEQEEAEKQTAPAAPTAGSKPTPSQPQLELNCSSHDMAKSWLIASVLCLCAAVPCAEASFPLRVPDEAFLLNLGPFSCRADLPDTAPLKNTPCRREELLEYGMEQESLAVALTVMAEVYPGDSEAAKLVLITVFTRRALVSSPGAEVTLTAIVQQPKQYTGWLKGRLSPPVITRYLPALQEMARAFIRGDFDDEPLRFTHYTLCTARPSWLLAARNAGIKILETSDGHCWITGTAAEPALILWPRPEGARKGVSWRRVRDNAPLMFAAIHGQQGKAAGLAMR